MYSQINWPAFGLASMVFVLAVVVAWALRRFSITDSVGFIALILLPLAAYGVASGFVSKISLPGGWAAEFRAAAGSSINPSPIADRVENLSIIEKGGVNEIDDIRRRLEPGKPIAITLDLGRTGYYSPSAIAIYIRSFLTFDPQLTVIFLREDRRFAASTNGQSILAALEIAEYGRRFISAVESSDLLALKDQIVLTTGSAVLETSNSAALQLMVNDGVETLVVLDRERKPSGIVRRDGIVSELMLTLTSR